MSAVSNWTLAKDDARMRAAIRDRRAVRVTSALTYENLWDAASGRRTVLARELKVLVEAGYRWDGDYLRPPEVTDVEC